jgi:hypothetical protein
VLLDVTDIPGNRHMTGPALFPSLAVDAMTVAATIAEQDPTAVAVVHLMQPDTTTLRVLLPLGDSIVIPGTRLGRDLDEAAELYAAVASLEIEGASGKAVRPWLLPAGWSCSRNPGTRLWGWRRQLERRTFPGRLRCLPMILPWTGMEYLLADRRDRVEMVGTRLLENLGAIAGGQSPVRPADGLAGGDPWPDCPVPDALPSHGRLPGTRMRLVHSVIP